VTALQWIQGLGFYEGAIVLTVANIIGAILFMPCVPFTLGAGFLFGLTWGSAIILLATNIASIIAFLTSRYLARSCVERRLLGGNSKFRLIDAAIKQDGFKIVALVRSSPLHPYGICNYLFGLTSVTFPSYVAANVIAMTPGTILEVWTGTSIHQLSDIISGSADQTYEHQLVFWIALLVTFIVTIILACWLQRKLKYEFAKYQDHIDRRDSDAVEMADFHVDPHENNSHTTNNVAQSLQRKTSVGRQITHDSNVNGTSHRLQLSNPHKPATSSSRNTHDLSMNDLSLDTDHSLRIDNSEYDLHNIPSSTAATPTASQQLLGRHGTSSQDDAKRSPVDK